MSRVIRSTDPEIETAQKLARVHNQRYGNARKEAAKAKASGDWHRYVFLHERPWRVGALWKVHSRIMRDVEYWQLLRDVWVDTEGPHQSLATWRRLWSTERPGRPKPTGLPVTLVIYRGQSRKGTAKALSWTLDRDRAIWFARRFAKSSSYLLTGELPRQHVLAYLTDRNEEEIVCLPERVQRLRVEAVPVQLTT